MPNIAQHWKLLLYTETPSAFPATIAPSEQAYLSDLLACYLQLHILSDYESSCKDPDKIWYLKQRVIYLYKHCWTKASYDLLSLWRGASVLPKAEYCLTTCWFSHIHDVCATISTSAGPLIQAPGIWLDAQDGWSFWRFNIEVQMISEEQPIDYSVAIPGSNSQATQ